jgi:hypothetical protein
LLFQQYIFESLLRGLPALETPAEAASHSAEDQRNQEQHERNEEDDLCYADCRSRDTTEAENSGDQCNDKQRNDQTKHGMLRVVPYGLGSKNSFEAKKVPSRSGQI